MRTALLNAQAEVERLKAQRGTTAHDTALEAAIAEAERNYRYAKATANEDGLNATEAFLMYGGGGTWWGPV
jgi:hypothetical protein